MCELISRFRIKVLEHTVNFTIRVYFLSFCRVPLETEIKLLVVTPLAIGNQIT